MNLSDLIKQRDIAGIKVFMNEHNLMLVGNKIVPKDESSKIKLKGLSLFWDRRQQARKILLNSLKNVRAICKQLLMQTALIAGNSLWDNQQPSLSRGRFND